MPGIALLRGYSREELRRDLPAGVVLAALLVPQGMAYAQLAGLPPVTGLYATLVPLETLRELNTELADTGIELAFAELKDPVRDWLIRYGLRDEIGQHRFWPTIGAAVTAYVIATGVDWVDWEDRSGQAP